MITKLFLFQVHTSLHHSVVTSDLCDVVCMCVQFVNSYASFFYIAFVASSMSSSTDDGGHGDCAASTCMIPLGVNLAIIFGETDFVVDKTYLIPDAGVQEVVTLVSEGILPYIMNRYRSIALKKYAQTEYHQLDMPQIAKEHMLEQASI